MKEYPTIGKAKRNIKAGDMITFVLNGDGKITSPDLEMTEEEQITVLGLLAKNLKEIQIK